MNEQRVIVGLHFVNLSAVGAAHWEGQSLYVHLVGGRFVTFKGDEAWVLWEALCREAVELTTGEVSE